MTTPSIIRFEPRSGGRLRRNLADHLPLLRRANQIPQLHGLEAEQAVIELVSAFQIALSPTDHATIRGRTAFDHLWELHAHNRFVHRLIPYDRPLVIMFSEKGEAREIDFGPYIGFTGVYPLTAEGFFRLISTDIGVSALVPNQVVPTAGCGLPQRFLYIGGVLDVRRLNHPEWIRGNPGKALLAVLKHAARFLPPLVWDREVWLATADGGPLPRVCAFADPGSESATILWRAGFRKVGEKWNGEEKYALDLEDWNSGVVDPTRRLQILATVRAFQYSSRHFAAKRSKRGQEERKTK